MLARLQRDTDGAAFLHSPHHPQHGVIAQMADEIAVMYAGNVVEYGDTHTLFENPRHPYTWGLLQSITRLDFPDRPLRPIAGSPTDS